MWQRNAQFLFSSSKASLTQMAQLAASISLQLDFLPDKSGGHGHGGLVGELAGTGQTDFAEHASEETDWGRNERGKAWLTR